MKTYTEKISELSKLMTNKVLWVMCGQLPVQARKGAVLKALRGHTFYASFYATDSALYINHITIQQ